MAAVVKGDVLVDDRVLVVLIRGIDAVVVVTAVVVVLETGDTVVVGTIVVELVVVLEVGTFVVVDV